jgi:hypothetical protein
MILPQRCMFVDARRKRRLDPLCVMTIEIRVELSYADVSVDNRRDEMIR